jgi:integrase
MSDGVGDELEAVLETIRESDRIDERDKNLLLEYNRRLRRQRSRVGELRRLKNLKHLRLLAGHSQKYDVDELPEPALADTFEDSEAVGLFLDWIHATYSNEETNRDYRAALRSLGEHATDGDISDPLDEISATTPNDYRPMPDPAKMYRWEAHIQPMLDAARYTRERAMIAVAWDAGLRSGELHGLRVGDVTDHKFGLSVTVDGKKGQRSVTLVPGVPYLRRWLENHPAPDDQSAPLWSDLDTVRDVTYAMKVKMLKKPARDADMSPPSSATPTRMRKSSASYLASQGVNQAHLEDHHGWKRGSDAAARYIAVFGDANDRAIAKAHGVEVEDNDPDPIAPVECPRCSRETPRERGACVWCGQALAQETAREVDHQRTEIMESLAETTSEEVAKALMDVDEKLGGDALFSYEGALEEGTGD